MKRKRGEKSLKNEIGRIKENIAHIYIHRVSPIHVHRFIATRTQLLVSICMYIMV